MLPRRRVIICGRQAALEHSICCACRVQFTVLNLDVVVRVGRHSFVVRTSTANLRRVRSLSVHRLCVQKENAAARFLRCLATVLLMQLYVGKVRNASCSHLLLVCHRQKRFRRVLPDDDFLLNSTITGLLGDILSDIRLKLGRVVQLHLRRRASVRLALVAYATTCVRFPAWPAMM